MQQIKSSKQDNFTPQIVEKKDDCVSGILEPDSWGRQSNDLFLRICDESALLKMKCTKLGF